MDIVLGGRKLHQEPVPSLNKIIETLPYLQNLRWLHSLDYSSIHLPGRTTRASWNSIVVEVW
jgi:hypothetical protein